MTTTVRIELAYHAGWDVDIYEREADAEKYEHIKKVATLTESGQVFEDSIWQGKDFIIRENEVDHTYDKKEETTANNEEE